MKTPNKINFEKLNMETKSSIKALEELIFILSNDIHLLEIKGGRTSDEEKIILAFINEKIKATQELDSKMLLANEYQRRCTEMEIIEEAERQDYLSSKLQVLDQAHDFKNNPLIPSILRKHLKQVLAMQTNKYNMEQKIAYHITLKKEVELCINYLANKNLKGFSSKLPTTNYE